VRRLESVATAVMRWMCGVKLKDWKSSHELLDRVGAEDIVDVMKRGRLLWFGHVDPSRGWTG
jgi:hypothetical protein